MNESGLVKRAQSWYPERFCRIRAACRTAGDSFDLDHHAALIVLDASRALKEDRTPYAEVMRDKIKAARRAPSAKTARVSQTKGEST